MKCIIKLFESDSDFDKSLIMASAFMRFSKYLPDAFHEILLNNNNQDQLERCVNFLVTSMMRHGRDFEDGRL